MKLIVDQIGAVAVISFPESNLDAGNNRAFVEAMRPIIDQNQKIIFDMGTLRFVDSSGLGSIMLCSRRVKDAGGLLKLCGLSESVRALFELVRMNRVFEIYDTREEAIQAFENP